MTDRLEELLALMDDEDEEERREDGSGLTEGGPPAITAPEKGQEERAAGEDAPADGSAPEQDAGEAENGAQSASAEEQVWPILDGDGPEAAAARRPERPGDVPPEEGTAPRESRDGQRGAEMARTVRRGDESGLDGLYRRAAQASRPAAPQALPSEQAGRLFRAEEPGRTAALTVEELDRAVRRDSRRYDGGMTLF